MSAKKLDQSVFEGLPSEYRWAVVDRDGTCAAFSKHPHYEGGWYSLNNDVFIVGYGYNSDNWQNSLIERVMIVDAATLEPFADQAAAEAEMQQEFEELVGKARSKPAPQVDWSKAPDGATHYNTLSKQWFAVFDNGKVMRFDGEYWSQSKGRGIALDFGGSETIKRPESIHDIARSIEAARIEEQACMPFPDGDARYFETSNLAEKRAQEMADKLEAAQKDVYARCSSYRVAAYPHYFKDVSAVNAIDLYHVARLYDITDPALFHAFKKIACAGKRGAKDQAQDVQEAIDALKRWQELNV